MEKELGKLFGFSRDAVVALRDDHICFVNAAAAALFGADVEGKPDTVLPGHLRACADGSVATAVLDQRSFQVNVSRLGELLVLVFAEDAMRPVEDLLSPGLRGAIGNALGSLCAAIDLLSGQLKDVVDERSRQRLSILYHNYYELRRLFGNLSTAADLRAGTMGLTPVSVDLRQLCKDLVDTLGVLLERPVELCFAAGTQPLFINGDADKLERMLINLIANSYRATPDGGRITVEVKKRGSRAVVSVADNGCGVAPEVLKNVFRCYEDAPLELRNLSGGGLGLTIARGIAELHGGAMIMESRQGEGTRVYVTLPLDNGATLSLNDPLPALRPDAMDVLLTELSGVLSSRRYVARFMD